MRITRRDLHGAAEQSIISDKQADALYEYLRDRPTVGPRFDLTHVLYYLGGLIAIGAMTLFMNLGWEQFGGWGIFFVSLAYAGAGLKLAEAFAKNGHAIPAGICATFVVALTPLAIYGLQLGLGFWPDGSVYREYHRVIRWHWLFLELGTLAVAAVVLWRHRYPFLLMPVAVTLWYLSMDLASMLTEDAADFEFRATVSLWFGLAMILLALWVDLRAHKTGDYAFWLYLFGVLTFWGGLTAQQSEGELARFGYFCINVGLLAVGAILARRVFVVFGALGMTSYLGHLAHEVFEGSWLFPVALTLLGLGIVYLGLVWQRHERSITQRLRELLPGPLRELLEARQA